MNTSMHGKEIRQIQMREGQEFRQETDVQKLKLSATHHGDHDQFWVIVEIRGSEVERFNARYLDSITWKS